MQSYGNDKPHIFQRDQYWLESVSLKLLICNQGMWRFCSNMTPPLPSFRTCVRNWRAAKRLTTEEVRLTLPVPFTETTTETILNLIRQNPKITTKELAVLSGMTNDGIYYHIKKLKRTGRIKRDGAERNGGQWLVIDTPEK